MISASEKVGPWWQRHRAWLAAVAVGYAVLLAALAAAGQGTDWVNATTAYFVAANLVVLWWYADTTKRLLQTTQQQAVLSEKQYAIAWRTHRESNKPYVVVERNQDGDAHGEYYLRNIGPGIAVNVWLVRMQKDGTVNWQTLGPLAPQAGRPISDEDLRLNLRHGEGLITFALYAEALLTRTAQWNATVNVRERRRGGEMRSMPLHVEPSDKDRSIEEVLGPLRGPEWYRLERALHDVAAGM